MTFTTVELTAFLEREGVEGLDGWTEPERQFACDAAGEWIDEQSGREFTPVSEARLFTGHGGIELDLPEFLSVSGVVVNGTAIDPSLYQLLPLNGSPKTQLRRTSGSWDRPSTQALGNVSIAALWGYASSVPNEVLRAAGHVAASQALAGGTIPDPTTVDVKSISAFSLSYTLANSDSVEKPAELIVAVARRILTPYVDITSRLARHG